MRHNMDTCLTILFEGVPFKPADVDVHREGVYLRFEKDGKGEDLEVICLPDARVKVMGVFTETVYASEAIKLIKQWHSEPEKKLRLEEEDDSSSGCCTEDVRDGLTELRGNVASAAKELRDIVKAPLVREHVVRSGLAFKFEIDSQTSAEAVCQCDGTVLLTVETEANHRKQTDGCEPVEAAQLINDLLPKTPKLDLE